VYIYSDEDNAPMNDENMPERLKKLTADRDCPNCIHKLPNGHCEMWDCEFEARWNTNGLR